MTTRGVGNVMEDRSTYAIVGLCDDGATGTLWAAGYESLEGAKRKADEMGAGVCVVLMDVKWDSRKVLYIPTRDS